MAVLELVNYGNPILRKTCNSVTDFSKLTDFIDDMFDTMYEEEGIGLAANQVGINMNIFVIWLVTVVAWNFGYPDASPIEDVVVAIILSLFSSVLKKYLKF